MDMTLKQTTQADWDAHLMAEAFQRRANPVDFRRWKSASQQYLRSLYPGSDLRVIDVTSGLGDHTVNLAEAGFRVDASDASPVAVKETSEACHQAKIDVRVFQASWWELGSKHPGRYDLVWNDALHWTSNAQELRAALCSFRQALKSGGALVFFFADARMPEPRAGHKIFEWDAVSLPSEELLWEAEVAGVRKSAVRLNRPISQLSALSDATSSPVIEQKHLIHTWGQTTLDVYTLWRIYRWDYDAISRLLLEVGFSRVESNVFKNDHGHEVAMNRAFV